jgi:thiol-disulfide isomerase/thioredoxin
MPLRARWIASMVAVLLVALGVVLAVQKRNEPSVPRLVQQHAPAPAFELTTLDGTTLDNRALAGKAYVVNFFNSWCIPCHQELPALKAFYEEHRGERDFAMIGIVRDDEEGAIREYVAREKIGWHVALGGAARAAVDFGTTGQPETFVVAPDGVAVCGAIGPSTHEALNVWLQAARNGQVCT